MGPQGLDHARGAGGVGPTGRADDLVDVAVAEQGEEGALDRPRGDVVGDRTSRQDRPVQVGGGDEPAEPHARGHGLAGGAEVGDPVPVEGGERRHGRDVVAELRVVVVLDHHGAGAGGRVDQGEPGRTGHDRAERVLVGGRDVGGDRAGEVGRRARWPEGRGSPARRPGSPRPPPGSRGPRAPRRRAAGRPGAGSGRRSCRWSPGSRRGRRGDRGCARGGWRARHAGRADRPDRRTTGARAPRRRRARHAARPRGAVGRSTGCRCRAGGGPARAGWVARGGGGAGWPRRPRRRCRSRAAPRSSPRRRAGRRPARSPPGRHPGRGRAPACSAAAPRPGGCRPGRRRGSGRRPGC